MVLFILVRSMSSPSAEGTSGSASGAAARVVSVGV